ncbi:MAG TPA: NAD(P)/FAD-dependent oxidoreductase [Pseudomonadota bacterium]|nr:NAD(P)/FAD-dependent oxidoreductase [Pseudomonadota bacterium]
MLPDLWLKIPAWPSVGRGRRVIVIGGGVAGLCAAWGLRAAGFLPVVLERTERVGGRIYTLRDHFGAQYVELGATRLPGNHPLPLAYIRHFGLPVVEYPGDETRQIYSVLGRRFVSSYLRGADYPDDLGLTAQERQRDAESLHDYYSEQALRSVSDPRDPDWPSAAAREALAGQSLYHYLDKLGASTAAKEIYRACSGTVIEIYDAMVWLASQRIEGGGQKSYGIAGGNDRLTSCFADSLGELVVRNAQVQAVRAESGGVRVDYLHNQRPESMHGDYVVCAVPHRILLELSFDPPLSAAKLAAAMAVPMGRVTRLNFQFSRRFWNLDDSVRGLSVACTTSLIERLWDLTAVQAGASGILTAYTQHEHAAALDRLPSDDERIQRGLAVIYSLFPNARGSFMKGLSFSWQQPWTKGAWPVFLAGQTRHIADFQRAEGRVYFAGEHTSLHTAWVQGALESAHFAVAEVIAASQKARGL